LSAYHHHREERAVPAAAVLHARGAVRREHRDGVYQSHRVRPHGRRHGEALRHPARRARLLLRAHGGRGGSQRARSQDPGSGRADRRRAGARAARAPARHRRTTDLRRRDVRNVRFLGGGLEGPLRCLPQDCAGKAGARTDSSSDGFEEDKRMAVQTTSTTTVEEYVASLRAAGLDAPWTRPGPLIQPKASAAQSRLWRWAEIEPLVRRSPEFMKPGRGAERRIIRLDNPGVPERTATHTIS